MRKRTRDEAARTMALKASRTVAAEQRVEILSKQIRDTIDVGRQDRSELHVEVAALKVQEYHGRWLHGQVAGATAELASARRACDEERIRLTEATAKLKAIEKLRERRWKRHMQEVRREEQAIMDEVAGRIGALRGEEVSGE